MNKDYFQNYNLFIFTIIALFFSTIIKKKLISKIIDIICMFTLAIFSYKHIQFFHIKKYNNKIPYNLKSYITNYIFILLSFLLILLICYRIFF